MPLDTLRLAPGRLLWRTRVRRIPMYVYAAVLWIAILAWGLSAGAMSLPVGEVLAQVFAGEWSLHSHILLHIRLPRLLMAAVVGALLALTGSAFQALFRNPLAEPSLLGVSAGASMGAAFSIVLGAAWMGVAWAQWEQWLMPLAAFVGSWLCTFFIFAVARTKGSTAIQNLLLAGVATNAMAAAVVGLLLLMATDTQARSITFWTMGSFGAANWTVLGIVCLLAIPVMAFLLWHPRKLDLLLLGETEATHLGLRVEHFKRILVTLTALGVGAAVAFTGIIGFVGLVAPHLVRMVAGPGHRRLLPLAALLGGALTMLADTLARIIMPPTDVPVGGILALVGVPFFLYLIRKAQKHLV